MPARSKALLALDPLRRLRRCADEPGTFVSVHEGCQLLSLSARMYTQDARVHMQLPTGVRLPSAREGPLRLHLAVPPWTSGLSRISQRGRGQDLSFSAFGEEDEPEMVLCGRFEIMKTAFPGSMFLDRQDSEM